MNWIPFKDISDNYKIESMLTRGVCDFNSIEVFKHLYQEGLLTNGVAKEVDGKIIIENEHPYSGEEYSQLLFSYLSKEYIDSAIVLANCVLRERMDDEEILSSYANPCAFLCRHAVELKLKQCLCRQNNPNSNTHNIKELWNQIDKSKFDRNIENELTFFIEELSLIDKNEMSLRYGTGKDLLPIAEKLQFDCIKLTNNTKYLFNKLHIIAF